MSPMHQLRTCAIDVLITSPHATRLPEVAIGMNGLTATAADSPSLFAITNDNPVSLDRDTRTCTRNQVPGHRRLVIRVN